MPDPHIHSDIKNRNYESRDQEIEAVESALKLQLKIGLAIAALVVIAVLVNVFV